MIYIKIYFTIIFLVASFTMISSSLIYTNDKNSELWWKITKVNLVIFSTLIVLLGIILVWFF